MAADPSISFPKIEVAGYDPNWPKLFEAEAKLIQQALGCNCIEIHHIGSTSIPNLSAKPIIDILAVVRNIQEVDSEAVAMESLGYEAKGENGMAFRRFFQKGQNIRTHHVHVYQKNDPEIERYLKFRDWLRAHPSDAESYGDLKKKLARQFPDDILQYCNGKDAMVASIDAKNGFEGWRIVKALTDREWQKAAYFRQKYFDNSNEDLDTSKDSLHFVLYKNAEIIGYMHLHLDQKNKAALKMMAIDEPFQRQRFGSLFLRQIERWLYHQKIQKLSVQSASEAHPFFLKQGYNKLEKHLTIDPVDRPKISIYIASSIDGFIARPDGGLDWLDRVGGFDEDYGFQKLLDSIDALIIGRKTYEVASTVPDPYPGKRVVVLSRTLNSVREDMELYRGDLPALLRKLHAEGVKHIWVDGGSTLSQFLALNAVDTLTLSVIPVILGAGIPLFHAIGKEIACRVASSQAYPSGLVQLRYEVGSIS